MRRRTAAGARARGAAWALALGVVASTVVLPGSATVARANASASATEAGGDGWSRTQKLTRTFVNAGRTLTVDERDVTVTVDRTTQLRGRERVDISWTGAHPTGGRASSPYGEEGLLQEYPVVVLQCRGVDEPRAGQEQLSRETCWTSSRMQRSQMVSADQAAWRSDLHASAADRELKSGVGTIPAVCEDAETFATHLTPFRAASGKEHVSCTSATMPPEAAVGAAFPPAEAAAFTDTAGNGHLQFEVRSDVENESLGCNAETACSIVVIPIQGLSCEGPDQGCRRGGQFEPGSSNFSNQRVDLAVSPSLWWSESNWRGRFSVPITFGLSPDACDVMDSRSPTGFYGSELMSQAALQWSPAYCLRQDRFKFQHNRMADGAAYALMENGGGVAALVSGQHVSTGSDPVAYAPTAVTGFSIGYVVDRPDNAGEVTDLRLNARLVAKLLTQSYPASDRGRGHPGMERNPVSINLDPEFRALNPGLDRVARESAATLISLSEESDVVSALTQYVAADSEAMAFVNGQADPWGMAVNPSYAKIELPRSEWPLLDDYVPSTNLECYLQNPSPYLGQVAAPVTHLRKIAEAVLDGWPNVQTKCDRSTTSDPWKVGRVDRQGVGTRFVLGVVSLGDAERFGLRSAALRTTGKRYVAPTDASMAAALKVARPSASGDQAFSTDMKKLVRAGNAYPGTLVVYTAAKTSGLPRADAAKVAQFIRVATGEGQRAGRGNGELPAGFVPIRRSGVTKALHVQARAVADAVAAQRPPAVEPEPGDGDRGADEPPATGPVPDGGEAPGDVPVSDPPATVEEPAPGAVNPEPVTVAMPATRAVSSPLARSLLPLLVVGSGLAALLAAGPRLVLWLRRRS